VPTKTIPKCIRATVDTLPRSIPQQIWQTFKTNTVPIGMYKAADTWVRKNPDFQYNFLTDDDCRQMIADFDGDLLKCYERTPPGAFRADILRYCALYQFGGVYADMDTVCKYPMGKLIQNEDQLIVAFDANPTKLFNAFMCAKPKHPILEMILNQIKAALLDDTIYRQVKANPTLLYDITGPGGLAQAVTTVMGLPSGIKFRAKTYSSKSASVRVLRKLHKKPLWSRRVMIGFRTVILCKYPGYYEDLIYADGSHWKQSGDNYADT
jgi:hypothetical protein